MQCGKSKKKKRRKLYKPLGKCSLASMKSTWNSVKRIDKRQQRNPKKKRLVLDACKLSHWKFHKRIVKTYEVIVTLLYASHKMITNNTMRKSLKGLKLSAHTPLFFFFNYVRRMHACKCTRTRDTQGHHLTFPTELKN